MVMVVVVSQQGDEISTPMNKLYSKTHDVGTTDSSRSCLLPAPDCASVVSEVDVTKASPPSFRCNGLQIQPDMLCSCSARVLAIDNI